MPNIIEGNYAAASASFAVIASRFNKVIVDQLLTGAVEALLAHGVRAEDIDVVWVPGSFEIPLVARQMASSGRYGAVICLGAVIRGETDHYEYVARAAADGVAQAARDSGVPVIFGVLTCGTWEQALERAGPERDNKGFEAALAAIEMANLLTKLRSQGLT